jgi:hypothetical protein
VVELAAAVTGAALSGLLFSLNGYSKRTAQDRDCLVRLSASVDNIAGQLEELHKDLRTDRVEIFSRLNAAERAIARLEGQKDQA